MWYFAWILGVLLACALGIINVLWLEAQESLQQDIVILDPLTKLPIRVEFLRLLEEKIARQTGLRAPFSLLLISLNDIPNLIANSDDQLIDTLVLDVKDAILTEIRQPLDVTARYDVATFALILSNTTLTVAEFVAQRICKKCEFKLDLNKKDGGISIGIVEFMPQEARKYGESVQDKLKLFVQTADDAMKIAAQKGANQYYSID